MKSESESVRGEVARRYYVLTAYLGLLATGCLTATVVGFATSRPRVAILAVPMLVFFTALAWLVSPSHIRRAADRSQQRDG